MELAMRMEKEKLERRVDSIYRAGFLGVLGVILVWYDL